MKFLLRPEFLTAVAAWLCALGAHLGWDIPPELVYGGASLMSIAAGGVAVSRNKKNGTKPPAVGMSILLIAGLMGLGTVLSGCNTVRAGLAAGQEVMSKYVVVSAGDFKGKVVFNSKHVVIDGEGNGLLYLKDRQSGDVIFSFPVDGKVRRAWNIVIVDDKKLIAFRDADVDETLELLGESPPEDPAVVVEP